VRARRRQPSGSCAGLGASRRAARTRRPRNGTGRPRSHLFNNKCYCRRKDVLTAAEQLPHLGALTCGDTHAVFGVVPTADAAGRSDIIVLSTADLAGSELAVRILAMETASPGDHERRTDWHGNWDRRQERWLVLRKVADLIEATPAA